MKQLELSRENLISLGLEHKATKTEIKEWARKNEDILIDFKNKIIYCGLKKLNEDSENFIAQLSTELKGEYSSSTVKVLTQMIKKDTAAELKELLDTMPEEGKREFMLKLAIQMREKLRDIKDDYDNNKINDFINKTYISKSVQDEKLKLLNFIKTPEIKVLTLDILHKSISKFSVVKYIEKHTSKKTRKHFLHEIYNTYDILLNEFMFSVKEDDIAEALKIFQDSLTYVYISRHELPVFKHMIRDIGEFKTIFNAWNLSEEPFENAIKFVHLNDMMISYFNDFYEYQIPEFGNMIRFRDLCDFLKCEYKYPIKINKNIPSDTVKEYHIEENAEVGSSNNLIKEEEKLYPRIFKDPKAFQIFKTLLLQFKNTKQNLSNYSYVFHKMTYEGLIHYDTLHRTYIDMLSEFNIHIDRIKPEKEIGKKEFRNSIYNSAKAAT